MARTIQAAGGPVQIAGFIFTVSELEGYRFIETVFPEEFDRSRLWAAASSYPTLWDESRPTVTLNDIRKMPELDDEARRVLRWVLQQNQIRARLLATSWVAGTNDAGRQQIEQILTSVGRPTSTVFTTRAEALTHLREAIREWQA